MKGNKIIMYIIIIALIISVGAIGYLVYINANKQDHCIGEYTPIEEITDEQLRQTVITLYFMDKETGLLSAEVSQIDSKKLLENPYYVLVQLLINGPKSEKLIKVIPEDAVLNGAEIKNGIVYIDFSEEFIKDQELGKVQEELIINSILNTLLGLNEVDGIYITINGEKNKGFPDNEINFSEVFKK